MKKTKWKVGIVEDEQKFRNAFSEKLAGEPDVDSVHTFESAELLLRDSALAELDILLVDHMLPHMTGIELIRTLNRDYPELPMIVISSILSDDVIFEAIRVGALGYVLKADVDDLGETVRQVMAGGAVISPTIGVRVMNCFRQPAKPDEPGLTTREEQVLRELVTGMPADDVARLLGITVGTLRNHIKNIYKKLNVCNKIELTRRAVDLGYG